ncbi:hypothetical protein BDQ17DRAFT_1354385, partial [Cyathus striatus]
MVSLTVGRGAVLGGVCPCSNCSSSGGGVCCCAAGHGRATAVVVPVDDGPGGGRTRGGDGGGPGCRGTCSKGRRRKRSLSVRIRGRVEGRIVHGRGRPGATLATSEEEGTRRSERGRRVLLRGRASAHSGSGEVAAAESARVSGAAAGRIGHGGWWMV